MSYRPWLFIAGLMGLAGVAIGAAGAHVARPDLAGADAARIFQTAQAYHMTHVIALLALAAIIAAVKGDRPRRTRAALHVAGACWTLGVALFCGALYARSLLDAAAPGGVAPVGGVLLMLGWAAAAVAALGQKGDEG